MVKLINGINGMISTDCLGVTLMHEHVLQANWSMRHAYKDWFDYDEFLERAVKDVKRTVDIGVQTIVEQTPVCLGRDIHAIKDVADRTGMQFIASTGFFHTENQWTYNRSIGSFLKYILTDIYEGIEDTDIRPGLIKCATGKAGITPVNEIMLKAHAMAASESGLPVSTHSEYTNRSGIGQMDIFDKYGLNPRKIIIGHSGDTNNIEYLEELLKRGCFIGLDRFGDNMKNPLEDRVNTLMTLCDRGWIDQIIISQDYVSFVDLGQFEWSDVRSTDPDDTDYNYRYIYKFALPLLRRKGFSEGNINQLLVGNPRKYFET